MVDAGISHAVVNGLVTGSYIALGAIGLGLVYNIAKVPNFAHGELLMVGAYLAAIINIPWALPGFASFTTEPEVGFTLGVIFFLGTAVSTLGVLYLLGGRRALEGRWWPIRTDPRLAIGVHVIAAIGLGLFVMNTAPSLFAGLIVATLVMAAATPVFDKYLFKQFREGGATLATMLIVTMGLAFAIRFGIQAIFGGSVRAYEFPREIAILGFDINISNFKYFDFFFTEGGLTLRVLDTAPDPNVVMFTVEYPWFIFGGILLGTVAASYATYRWQTRGRQDYSTVQTFGPKLVAPLVGIATFGILMVVLSQTGSVPSSTIHETRIRTSYLRLGIILIAIILMVALHILLLETKLGKAMRASADNLDLAKVTGIDTSKVMMTTWIIAGAYAAIGGVMVGMLFHSIRPSMGFFILLPMFAAVILGGLSSIYGAIVGSYVVGIAMEVGLFATGTSGVHRPSIAFLVLLVVLLAKPEGIIGGR